MYCCIPAASVVMSEASSMPLSFEKAYQVIVLQASFLSLCVKNVGAVRALAGSSCGALVDTDFKVVLHQLPSNFFNHDIFFLLQPCMDARTCTHTCMHTQIDK